MDCFIEAQVWAAQNTPEVVRHAQSCCAGVGTKLLYPLETEEAGDVGGELSAAVLDMKVDDVSTTEQRDLSINVTILPSAAIAHWQIKRDGGRRGIVEVTPDDQG